MRSASFRLLLALLAGTVAACSRPQAAAFTQSVAERLKAASKGAEVAVVAPLQIAITPQHGKRTALDLTDLWKTCGRLDCGEPVETYVRSVLSGTVVIEAPAKREYLRPLIRTSSNLPPAEATAVSEPLVGDLVIVYVFDSGDARRPMMPADLAALGLDKAGLRAAAVANLGAATAAIPHEPSDPAPHVFVVTTGDDYAASRLLLLEGWGALKPEVEGDLLAIAPHQRSVFFTGSGEDKATRGWLKSLAADHMDGAGSLSPAILKWTPQGWVPFAG